MTILDQDIPLRANIFFTLQRHRTLWLFFCLTAAVDLTTTINFMINDGINTEANALVRDLAQEMGMFYGVLLGKSMQIFSGIAFCALSRNLSKGIVLALCLANCLAVYVNTLPY